MGNVINVTANPRGWLEHHIKRGINERVHGVVDVSPALAAEMLKRNTSNRRVRPTAVQDLASRLKNGTFVLTHQGISFASNGVLLDGQHRLLAIIEAGIPGKMQVTFGSDPREFAVVDQGLVRSAASILEMKGANWAGQRAALARSVASLEKGTRANLRNAEAAEYAERMLGTTTDRAIGACAQVLGMGLPSAVILANYHILTKSPCGEDAAYMRLLKFWENMATGENLTGAKLRLREYMKAPQREVSSLKGWARAAVIINAYNAWLSNRAKFDTTWTTENALPGVK